MTTRTPAHLGDTPALLLRATRKLISRATEMHTDTVEADWECRRFADELRDAANGFERRVAELERMTRRAA
jgi:hypothetical protein